MIHFKCLRVSAGISLSFGRYFIGTSSGRAGREIFFVTSPIVIVLVFLPLPPSPLPPFSSLGVEVIESAIKLEGNILMINSFQNLRLKPDLNK